MTINRCPTCGSGRIREALRNSTGEFRGKTYQAEGLEFYECRGIASVSDADGSRLKSARTGAVNPDTLVLIGESADRPKMNRLYYGDNLDVLRGCIDDESVDLVYLDPPFNSQATYNVLFRSTAGEKSRAQIEAFEDTWHWGDEAELAFDQVMTGQNTDAAEMLRSMRAFLKENDMMAYLAMMAVRLSELHRVLKPTGSLYLHCDPTASHYLKILLDSIYGVQNFRNEIIWKRTSARSDSHRWNAIHDTIFFYSKTDAFTWVPQYTEY